MTVDVGDNVSAARARVQGFVNRALAKSRYELHRARIPPERLDQVQRLEALPFRRRLAYLAEIFGTDKGLFRHGYVTEYQRHLGPVRHRVDRVLEIGVLNGASLKVWREFFPKAEIFGLDIDEKSVAGPRLQVLRGDQSDAQVLARLRLLGPFDLIIDDGSHIGAHINASFEGLFEAVRPGGWYVIEDMATAYRPAFGGGAPGTPGTSAELVKSLVDAVNRNHVEGGDPGQLPAVREMHLYDEIVFIRRD
jgi:hypothetical protein